MRALRWSGNQAIVPLHLLPRGPRASASGGAACGEAAAVGEVVTEVVGRSVADHVGCYLIRSVIGAVR